MNASALVASLPPPWPEDLQPAIRAINAARPRHKLVVLDDDPTGTQTVHDVPVLTVWDEATLRAEFAQPEPCFYILTNSRSLTPAAARELNLEVARALRVAAAYQPPRAAAHGLGGRHAAVSTAAPFTVVSRSDSTLRGHFPVETDALAEELGPFNATLLIPYFEAGGRLTIDDVHYVAEGDTLTPAADTPFALDAAFGYRHSNLREWVEEKTAGRIRAEAVHSISLRELRTGTALEEPTHAVTEKLLRLPRGSVCIVNAAHPRDVDVFTLAALRAELAGRRFLYRTAASFVASRLAIGAAVYEPPNQPATASGGKYAAAPAATPAAGGLIVVGSHVPKSTEQLNRLLAAGAVMPVELPVGELLQPARANAAIAAAGAAVETHLRAGRDVVVFTSREVLAGGDAAESLGIAAQISGALVAIVRSLECSSRFVIAKGGITSSDLATKALGVRRARVLGQLLPGVPVWQLGPETKFPGLDYVIFPGNVGSADGLLDAWRKYVSSSTPHCVCA